MLTEFVRDSCQVSGWNRGTTALTYSSAVHCWLSQQWTADRLNLSRLPVWFYWWIKWYQTWEWRTVHCAADHVRIKSQIVTILSCWFFKFPSKFNKLYMQSFITSIGDSISLGYDIDWNTASAFGLLLKLEILLWWTGNETNVKLDYWSINTPTFSM